MYISKMWSLYPVSSDMKNLIGFKFNCKKVAEVRE